MNPRLPALAAAVAVASWTLADRFDIPSHRHLTDLPVYESAARAITGGAVPYRDFAFEYPPLAAGLVTLARVLPLSYAAAFSVLMLIALVATTVAAVAIARALRLSRARQAAAGIVVALVPLVLGDFVATRFDLAVAAPVAWTAWAAVTGRWRLAWGLLAAAVALKAAPIVLAPLLFAWHRRHRGARPAIGGLGASLAASALTFVPFLALSPGGVGDLFRYHLDRPLQIESLGSAYLLGLHALTGEPVRVETTFGSQNLIGTGPDVLAAISAGIVAVGVAAILVTTVVLLRRVEPPGGASLFMAGVAATLALTVGAGKVLSPQFLIWLLPATLLVARPYGRHAFAATIAALAVTQLYFPTRYWDLVALDTVPIALLVLRDALLVALVAFAWPRPWRAAPATLPARHAASDRGELAPVSPPGR